MSTKQETIWMDCGEGTLINPTTGNQVTTSVVELQGHGRIFEILDYSNEPDQNFRLILKAPQLRAELIRLIAMLEVMRSTAENYAKAGRDVDFNVKYAKALAGNIAHAKEALP